MNDFASVFAAMALVFAMQPANYVETENESTSNGIGEEMVESGPSEEASEEADESGYSESSDAPSQQSIEETDMADDSDEVGEVAEPVVLYTSDDLRYSGVIYHGGWTYTWYSESELPGQGLDIPGRHHEDGFIMDEYGNVCVACCDYARGTAIEVPFGNGHAIVYDYCPTSGVIDVYLP